MAYAFIVAETTFVPSPRGTAITLYLNVHNQVGYFRVEVLLCGTRVPCAAINDHPFLSSALMLHAKFASQWQRAVLPSL